MPDEVKVSVRELREHLSDHIRRVSGGGSVVITRNGEPVARLGPVLPKSAEPRPFGFMQGQIRMAPDFDETPADMLASIDADVFPSAKRRR